MMRAGVEPPHPIQVVRQSSGPIRQDFAMSRSMPTASRTPLRVFDSPESAGAYAAAETFARLERAARRGTLTLGCPGGRSLRTTYAALARLFGENHFDLTNLHVLMMDEYAEARGERWASCP